MIIPAAYSNAASDPGQLVAIGVKVRLCCGEYVNDAMPVCAAAFCAAARMGDCIAAENIGNEAATSAMLSSTFISSDFFFGGGVVFVDADVLAPLQRLSNIVPTDRYHRRCRSCNSYGRLNILWRAREPGILVRCNMIQ